VARPARAARDHGGRALAVFLLFAAAYFLSQFYRSANAVIARDLSSDLALSAGQLGLMTSLFYASFALVQLPLGAGLDRWGPRWVTPGLMLVGAGGAVVFGSAGTFSQLALGRALIGAGMAGCLMGSYKVFSQWFAPQRFATLSGLLVGMGAVGALSAGAPLAALAGTYGWRAVFYGFSVATLLSALSIMLWSRNSPPGKPWSVPWREEGTLGDVFRSLVFWRIALLDLFIVGPLLAIQGLWGGPFLFDVAGMSQAEAGTLLTLLSLGALVGYLASGFLAARFGHWRMAVAGGLGFFAAQAGLVLSGLAEDTRLLPLIYPLFGFSGAFNILLMAHARHAFPVSLTGRAVTAVNLFGMGGAAVMQILMGVIIGSFGRDEQGHYPPQAYVTVFSLLAGGTLLATLAYATLGGDRMADAPAGREGPRAAAGGGWSEPDLP